MDMTFESVIAIWESVGGKDWLQDMTLGIATLAVLGLLLIAFIALARRANGSSS